MCNSKENATENARECPEKLRFEGEEADADALRERATLPPLTPRPMSEDQQRAWMTRSPSECFH